MSFNFRYFRWSVVLPKLKRHLNAKNTLNDHDSIRGHRNFIETERSAIACYRNFNSPKICKITVLPKSGPGRAQQSSFWHYCPSLSPVGPSRAPSNINVCTCVSVCVCVHWLCATEWQSNWWCHGVAIWQIDKWHTPDNCPWSPSAYRLTGQ